MSNFKDVMLDLEMLGTAPGCVILSIGAVAFDPLTAEIGPDFYQVISTNNCMSLGLTVDPETITWWMKQDVKATEVIRIASDPEKSAGLPLALMNFKKYLESLGPMVDTSKSLRIWGNGSDFDQPILAAAYRACSIPLPWRFYNNRCYRTLKGLAPNVKMDRIGTYHNALDDARSQAIHAGKIFEQLVYKGGATWPDPKQAEETIKENQHG